MRLSLVLHEWAISQLLAATRCLTIHCTPIIFSPRRQGIQGADRQIAANQQLLKRGSKLRAYSIVVCFGDEWRAAESSSLCQKTDHHSEQTEGDGEVCFVVLFRGLHRLHFTHHKWFHSLLPFFPIQSPRKWWLAIFQSECFGEINIDTLEAPPLWIYTQSLVTLETPLSFLTDYNTEQTKYYYINTDSKLHKTNYSYVKFDVLLVFFL